MVEMGEGAELCLMSEEEEIEKHFPNLVSQGYRIASPATPRYNCVAWAAGGDDAFWWPDPMEQAFWPEDVPRQESIDAFVQAFRTLGYTPCGSARVAPGLEKVAIYVNERGTPTHVARQLPDGDWTSKLGRLEDIEHATLGGLEGSFYGSVRLIMSRRT